METEHPNEGEPDVPLFLDDVVPPDVAEADVPPNTPEPERRRTPDVTLPSGEALRLAEAAALTAASPVRVVAVLGEQESGKTTLFASLWERFLRGPYEGVLFAGSQTQRAFDWRCFDARVASGRDHAKTERTEVRQDDDRYVLHLAVRPESVLSAPPERRPSVQHLLFPDLSGEDLREARQSRETARSFPLVRRADHVVFLADGERLADPALRHEAAANVKTLLRRLVEEDVVGDAYVQVVVTKDDLLTRGDADPGAEAYVEGFLDRMVETFGGDVRELATYRIAARPEGTEEIVVGVGPLFRSWLATSPYAGRSLDLAGTGAHSGDRESMRWARQAVAPAHAPPTNP